MHTIFRVLLSFVILSFSMANASVDSGFVKKLEEAVSKVQVSIDKIYNEWQVAKYPNFLKGCFMHKGSWEMMKYKLEQKIFNAAETKTKSNFVISFTGR